MLEPSFYFRTHTIGQSMLTMVGDVPWMLAASEVKRGDTLLGFIMLGVPLDSELLSAIHRYDVNPNVTALVEIKGDDPRILSSSDPALIGTGSMLSEVEKKYLITGRDFFDYGSSDVPVHFVSLRSRSAIDAQLAIVLDVVAQQRLIQSVALVLVFLLMLLWLTNRMRRLSAEVRGFVAEHLDTDMAIPSADSLIQLESYVQYMEQKVIEVRQREKLQAEEKLKSSEVRLHDFFEYAQELIQSIGSDGQLLYVNKMWLEEMGYSEAEVTTLHIQDLIHPHSMEHCMRVFHALQKGQEFGWIEATFISKDGREIEVEGTARCHLENGMPTETHSIFRNVTERQRKMAEESKRQQQMEHTQRLESLGVLAGGIAHDFNNLLTAIMGNASLAMELLEKQPSPIQERLLRIVQSSERAADLCRQMLAYSGKGKFITEPVHLPSLLREMTQLLSVSIHKQCELTLNLDDDVPMIEADKAQLQQVIMNLITNANEAIGDMRGTIHVRSGSVMVDADFLNECVGDDVGEAGAYLFIEVKDSGCGMDKATIDKIFEPFLQPNLQGVALV